MIFEIELKAGDTLYLPRGFVHEAKCNNSSSLHLSVSLDCFKWRDVFGFISDRIESYEGFRESLSLSDIFEDSLRSKLLADFESFLVSINPQDIKNHLQSKIDNRLFATKNDHLDFVRSQLK